MAEHATSQLHEYPFKTVRLACRQCERQERFSKDKLIVAHGGHVIMRELRPLILECEQRRGRGLSCGAFYPDLVSE